MQLLASKPKTSKPKSVKYIKVVLVVVLVLIADQVLKIWVFNNMSFGYNGEIQVFGLKWFRLHYTLNNGIAFGFLDSGASAYKPGVKIILTLFRLFASGLIIYLIVNVIKKGLPSGFVVALSFILAGALGNIIDSIFYDIIFNTNYLNDYMAQGAEVRKWFQGSVIDMLYFPLIDTTWPQWMPGIGGNSLQFFRPVFNIADSSITVGTFMIILFYRKTLRKI